MRRIQTSFTRKLIWSIKISLRKIFVNIYAKFISISTKIFASHIKKVEGVKRKMATTYKVCVCDGLTTDIEDTICFRPNGDTYDDFMEEILIRMPELRTETLRVFYQGKLRPFFFFIVLFLYFLFHCVNYTYALFEHLFVEKQNIVDTNYL